MQSSKSSARKQAFYQKKGLWALILILLLAGGGAAWYFLGGAGQAQAKSAPQALSGTQTTPVKRGDLTISASGSGTLTVLQSVDLSFSTGGTVTELNVKLGDTVKTGDVLASLGNAESLEANLAEKQVALLEAKTALKALQDNAGVSLAQAYQNWIDAQDTYNTALTTSQRTTGARCSSEVTARYTTALERATQKLKDLTEKDNGSEAWTNAKNDYDTAQANYTYCVSYTSVEKTSAQSELEVAKNAMQQAEAKYNTLKDASGIDPNELALDEARAAEAEAQLSDAQDQLKGITITAPIDGKIVYLAASQGTIVEPSKFITISDVSRPALDISVDESDMNKLTVGSSATVIFDALPDSVFTGKVIQVNPQLTTSGQYKVVKGVIELDAGAVKTVQGLPLGLNATVTIISNEAKNVLLVPSAALKDQGNQTYSVMRKGSDGQLKMQPVQVGLNDGTSAEITSGLKEGDEVSTGTAKTNSSSSDAVNPFDAGGPPPDGGMMMPPGR